MANLFLEKSMPYKRKACFPLKFDLNESSLLRPSLHKPSALPPLPMYNFHSNPSDKYKRFHCTWNEMPPGSNNNPIKTLTRETLMN